MHHTRLKAAVARYVDEEMKPTQLLEAIRADDKEYTPEEVDEIFEAIMLEKNPKTPDKDPALENKKVLALAVSYVVCDIWHGSWVVTKSMRNPLTGQNTPIAFNFLKSGSAKREKVKVEQRRMDALNEGAHINIPGIVVEQLIPVGHKGEWSYEREIVDGIPQ